MQTDEPQEPEDRDSVAPQPEERDPADVGGDSPGSPIGVPDEPSAVDRPGTTAEEQREPSLERRLAMERPDEWGDGGAGAEPRPGTLVDDDVAVEDLDVERPDFEVEDADLDRTPEEAAEASDDVRDDGPEGAAMHLEPE
jgi:hypothetical protein